MYASVYYLILKIAYKYFRPWFVCVWPFIGVYIVNLGEDFNILSTCRFITDLRVLENMGRNRSRDFLNLNCILVKRFHFVFMSIVLLQSEI